MKFPITADILWGPRARFGYLLLAAILLLTSWLGARDIWTQEHRWADIVTGMFYRHDFFHPYLGGNTYYDKPLLSYWLIAFFAKISGGLSTWALRLPSVLAGLLAIFSIYRLGTQLKSKSLGLLSGWLLLTTFYFVFWSRTSSADMLNLGGSLFAIAWYIGRRNCTDFFSYWIFFLVLALTALCKGLIGVAVPIFAVLVDILLQKNWKTHLRLSLVMAALLAAVIYLLPFLASMVINGETYQQNGLYLVYRENILRYFKPFDHQGPIYTYFIYLPLYLFPWSIFLPFALFSLKARWKEMSIDEKWIGYTLALLFLFFTLSGSRRSYYVLPMVPFGILFIADWLLPYVNAPNQMAKKMIAGLISVFLLLLLIIDILPAWYYAKNGTQNFASLVKNEALKTMPWESWHVVLLDAESKLNFYLQLNPNTPQFGMKGDIRTQQNKATLVAAWPILKNKPKDTIFISRKMYQPLLQEFFMNYKMVELKEIYRFPFQPGNEGHDPIAFIPH
jgi:4-amino-4-deoxy-L-arabinose transferase-like glycosyltransferase